MANSQQPNPSPLQNIQAGMDRQVFASYVLQSIPQSYWGPRLGSDPAKWAGEAVDIRDAFEAEFAKSGIGIQLPMTVSTGGSVGPIVRAFYALYREKHPERFAHLPQAVGGAVAPPRQ